MFEKFGKVRVGILRGGSGNNYETSLREGNKILSYINSTLPNKCKAYDIFVDKEGVWHIQGVPILPMDLIHKVEVIWDTTVPALSQVLEGHIPLYKIPHFANSMANSKALLREHMKSIGVKVINSVVIPAYQEDFDGPKENYAVKKAKEVWQKFPSPWLVKSFNKDPNVGIHIAKTFPELINAIEDMMQHNETILVEELIEGRRGGLHLISGFRNKEFYSFPPYEFKGENILAPGNFSHTEKESLYVLSENIYNHLGSNMYLHFNFVLNKNKGVYITDIHLAPDFTEKSHLFISCENIGIKPESVFEHILESSLRI